MVSDNFSAMLWPPTWIAGSQLMNKAWRKHLNFSMKQMNVSEQEFGLEIVSFIITPPGGLITVLVVRYSNLNFM